MLLHIILSLLLLFTLFLLSQKISSHVYALIQMLTKSEGFSLWVFILLFLPGTIIHELSHFFVATILRVSTGELSILPTIEKRGEEGEIKAGKLMVGKTDPFRQSLIGLAPVLIGLFLIYTIGKIFLIESFSYSPLLLFTICYLLFAVSTTMFSSRKDLESLMIALPIGLLLVLSLYLIGVRIFLEKTLMSNITSILSDLNYFLLTTAILDLIIYLFLVVNLSFWRRILRR